MSFCYICKEIKDKTEFHKNKSRPNGLDTRCKVCAKKRNKKYREEHKEYFINKLADYYQNNRKAHNEYMKELREMAMEKSNSGLTMSGIHYHIKQIKPKPEYCSICNNYTKVEIASINHTYTKDTNDWIWLCRKCHILFDSLMSSFSV